METTERFPQGLGNLAQHARFPHSHSRSFVGLKREKNRRTRAQTATSINNRPSRSPRPWWPVLKCRSVAGFQVSTEGMPKTRFGRSVFRRGRSRRMNVRPFQAGACACPITSTTGNFTGCLRCMSTTSATIGSTRSSTKANSPSSRQSRTHDASPERAGARPRTVAECMAIWISSLRSPIRHIPRTSHRSPGSAARTIRTPSIQPRWCSTIPSSAGKRPSSGSHHASTTGKEPMARRQEGPGDVRPDRPPELDRRSVQRHYGESSISRVASARRRRCD